VKHWLDAYNDSAIHPDDAPPIELPDLVKDSYVFSSNLPRALHSAELCSGRPPNRISEDFKEMELPSFKLPLSPPITLSVNTWLILFRVCWMFGLHKDVESRQQMNTRLADATRVLRTASKQENNIVVFGHGLANRRIAKNLRKRGWRILRNDHGYWSVIELAKH